MKHDFLSNRRKEAKEAYERAVKESRTRDTFFESLEASPRYMSNPPPLKIAQNNKKEASRGSYKGVSYDLSAIQIKLKYTIESRWTCSSDIGDFYGSTAKEAMGQFRKAVDVGPVSKAPVSSLHQIPLNSIKRSDYMLVGKLRDISNRMRRMASGEPSVYVSTYKKYSEGSLQGKWLNLDRFDSRKEFLAACRELHKDEADPELMFQDFENFPEAFYGESALADALWEWLELAKYEREAVSAYLSQNDFDLKVSDILGGFLDTASSMEEFVSEHYQPENLSPSVLSHYLVITPADIRVIAGEEASSRVDSMSDTEILKEARMADEYESEDDPRKRVAILERARDEVASDVSEEIQRQLKRDPLDYFSDIMGYDAHAVLENNLMSFDYPAFTRDLKRGFVDGDVVDFISYDGKIFVFSWI